MPLVDPLPADSDAEVAELAKFFNETLGFFPNSVLTMMRRPEIAKAFIGLNMAVMQNHGRVGSALKRLVGYVSSHATGCRYCQAHTIRAAERYGAEAAQMEHIWEFAPIPPSARPNGSYWSSRPRPRRCPTRSTRACRRACASTGTTVRSSRSSA
ncbi:carboxymuconolactone decarboxylase family protein [Marilutibacter chinensis]|uniref:carboxymuconolactone decarboxylase family protein n=1 Tax=Marilutibacter chinensis TaxID=2912247 RepID=UPI003CCCAE60